jgi:hypothetical protein
MNRMALIVVAFCAVLFTTVGLGAATPEPKMPPSDRVVDFSVTYNDMVVGKLSVNTNQWKYILNAHDLDPGTQYYFYCLGKFPYISKETADEDGNLHMQGAWDPQKIDIVVSPEIPLAPLEFVLKKTPIAGYNIGAVLTAHYTFTPVTMTVWGNLYDQWNERPIANQEIEILHYSLVKGYYVPWNYVYTDSNGNYKKTDAALPRINPPNVFTVPDPEFDYCRPYCCIFTYNGEYFDCVATLAQYK